MSALAHEANPFGPPSVDLSMATVEEATPTMAGAGHGGTDLYERLGGIHVIAALADDFSDQLARNPKVLDANPELRQRHTATLGRR